VSLEKIIDDLVDYLATLPEDKVDPETWRRLLIYVPAWLVKERAKKDREMAEK
jgi:hypothetical protein